MDEQVYKVYEIVKVFKYYRFYEMIILITTAIIFLYLLFQKHYNYSHISLGNFKTLIKEFKNFPRHLRIILLFFPYLFIHSLLLITIYRPHIVVDKEKLELRVGCEQNGEENRYMFDITLINQSEPLIVLNDVYGSIHISSNLDIDTLLPIKNIKTKNGNYAVKRDTVYFEDSLYHFEYDFYFDFVPIYGVEYLLGWFDYNITKSSKRNISYEVTSRETPYKNRLYIFDFSNDSVKSRWVEVY